MYAQGGRCAFTGHVLHKFVLDDETPEEQAARPHARAWTAVLAEIAAAGIALDPREFDSVRTDARLESVRANVDVLVTKAITLCIEIARKRELE